MTSKKSSPEIIWEFIDIMPSKSFTISDIKTAMGRIYPDITPGRISSALANWIQRGLLESKPKLDYERCGPRVTYSMTGKKPKFHRAYGAKKTKHRKPHEDQEFIDAVEFGEKVYAYITSLRTKILNLESELSNKASHLEIQVIRLQEKIANLVESKVKQKKEFDRQMDTAKDRIKQLNNNVKLLEKPQKGDLLNLSGMQV